MSWSISVVRPDGRCKFLRQQQVADAARKLLRQAHDQGSTPRRERHRTRRPWVSLANAGRPMDHARAAHGHPARKHHQSRMDPGASDGATRQRVIARFRPEAQQGRHIRSRHADDGRHSGRTACRKSGRLRESQDRSSGLTKRSASRASMTTAGRSAPPPRGRRISDRPAARRRAPARRCNAGAAARCAGRRLRSSPSTGQSSRSSGRARRAKGTSRSGSRSRAA
ncbi:MAG: hypothetical protein FAZ92_04005 [Accumulibacter sp.]|jgi:hypothetical protein|nr:MAG: hypothetical protein FAZ92_04005 [Accumulibacter sp.]